MVRELIKGNEAVVKAALLAGCRSFYGYPITPAPTTSSSCASTSHVLIPDSKVPPRYPELARIGRLEASVILQAVIQVDGRVGDLRVLRCTQLHVGFEEEAVRAVGQWRYEPARQDGRPVEVYFTVVVDFELL